MTGAAQAQANPEAEAHFSRARALFNAGRDDEAIPHIFRTITLEPELAMARLLLGEILLRRGEYRAGWLEYEWGSRLGIMGDVTIQAPQWNGMRLGPGNLILVGSQGYGDVIQFARYLPLAAERCARLAVGCSPELSGLIASVEGVSEVFTHWDRAPSFAAYAPLTSLPNVFGTTLDTIPFPRGYLAAAPDRAARWRDRLAGLPRGGRRVGLVWSGRPSHPNDARRSMPLAALSPLLDLPDVACVAVQKVVTEAERGELEGRGHIAVGPDLADFADTAALLQSLDLVVTVDTSVAHLAGALGRPVWIMLPLVPDWRWLTGRGDSPWYASARLFRQERLDDWAAPVGAIVRGLRQG